MLSSVWKKSGSKIVLVYLNDTPIDEEMVLFLKTIKKNKERLIVATKKQRANISQAIGLSCLGCVDAIVEIDQWDSEKIRNFIGIDALKEYGRLSNLSIKEGFFHE